MAALYGIDVSYANGTLNWQDIAASGEVDFAILRAGYGRNNLDAQFLANAAGCSANGIPFGIYWFSYALSVQDAANEGYYAVQRLRQTGLQARYLIWFDWEYDSDDYAAAQGVTMTNALRRDFALAFLAAVNAAGEIGGIYSNPDYLLNKGMMDVVTAGYPLWLAQWGVQQPTMQCSVWQYGITTITGVSGQFDGDIIGDGYPPIPVGGKKKMPIWMYLRRLP